MGYLPAVSSAQFAAQCFINKINEFILFPLITLLMAIAFLVFLYGAFEYVRGAANETARAQGKQHLLYGTIGMLVMLSAFTILSIAAGTFNIPLFDAQVVACEDGPVVSESVSLGVAFDSAGPQTPAASFEGDATAPAMDTTAPALLTRPAPPPAPPLEVDTLPVIDTSAPPCPENKLRVDGECKTVYPFTILNDSQIEVSCSGDSRCIGAINTCSTLYGGIYTGARTSDSIICNDSNFSRGPVETVTYANAPEGMFTAPPELQGYQLGIDTPPKVESFKDSVRFAGTNIFVTPEFEENFQTYVEPYVIENNADEQALLDSYAEYGISKVLFMIPQVETQAGGTLSQAEARCMSDLKGEWVLESGPNKVTSVSTYACLK